MRLQLALERGDATALDAPLQAWQSAFEALEKTLAELADEANACADAGGRAGAAPNDVGQFDDPVTGGRGR